MSANPSLVGSLELLANGQFPGNWVPIGPKSNWELNPAGELIQKSLVGTKRQGTGAILAQKDSTTFPIQELKLVCRPGSQFKAGVVFNLVDEKNFSVFCIDQHSRRTRGYDLVVFEVEDGDYNVISKEAYTITQPEVIILTLRQMGQNLLFFFNDSLAYTWTEKSLSGGKVGLYSYKNNDAAFLSLNLNSFSNNQAPSGARPMETQPVGSNGNVINQPAQPMIQAQPAPFDSRDGIIGYLNIKKPASKTEIEFTEVFTVPLDSFYSSLYQNTSLDNSDRLTTSGASEVQLLDLRVKRWYRELKAVREDLAFAKSDLSRKKDRVIEAETKLSVATLTEEQYEDLEKNLATRRTEYRISLDKVNRLRDQEQLLLREIRVNGFTVKEQTSINTIKELGYDFHIVGQGHTVGQYDPIEFEDNANYSLGDVWKVAEQNLYHQLFDSQAITEKGAALYLLARDKLQSMENCTELDEQIKALNEDLVRQQLTRSLYELAITNWYEERLAWGIDLELLEKLEQSFLERYAPNYGGDTNRMLLEGRVWEIFNTEPLRSISHISYPPKDAWGYIPPLISNWMPREPFNRALIKKCKLNRFEWFESYRLRDEGWGIQSAYYGSYVWFSSGLAIYYDLESGGIVDYSASSFFAIATWTDFHWSFNWDGSNQPYSIHNFQAVAVQVCKYHIDKALTEGEKFATKIREIDAKVAIFSANIEDLKLNGLTRLRKQFLDYWNNPATNLTAPIETKVIPPDDDPLAEFLASIAGHSVEEATPIDTYFFAPTPDGFYNQNGLSLHEFMKTSPASGAGQDVICVFPVFDSQGRISNEMIKAVRNPQKSIKTPSLPTIKFVESYRVEVGWLGYGLGELSHSFNLFPGETKELVIEKSTKLKTKLEETRKTAEETISKQTSSFEDNLQNELSVGEKAAQESSSASKQDSSQSASTEDVSTSESSVEAEASGGMFGFSAKAKVGSKSSSTSKRNSAWAASQSAEQKRASNQSKDVLSKNVSNAIRKVASETSQNNKLEFSAVSSREYEESTSNREVIKLQNPNVGRTINYNFFQVQNLFGVTVKLMDVQIVIDSGVEMVKGTGINDVRVYELEEFGKIYANSDESDRAAALAAIVVRQVMKHYGDFAPGVTSGSGAVGIGAGVAVQREMIEVLNFSSEEGSTVLKDRIDRIKTALEYLKGIPFRFRETVLTNEATVAVNCGAYHVESQLGFLPATEAYLETRRDIETEKQRAQVAHLKAQTEAKVFFAEHNGGTNANKVVIASASNANSVENKDGTA